MYTSPAKENHIHGPHSTGTHVKQGRPTPCKIVDGSLRVEQFNSSLGLNRPLLKGQRLMS